MFSFNCNSPSLLPSSVSVFCDFDDLCLIANSSRLLRPHLHCSQVFGQSRSSFIIIIIYSVDFLTAIIIDCSRSRPHHLGHPLVALTFGRFIQRLASSSSVPRQLGRSTKFQAFSCSPQCLRSNARATLVPHLVATQSCSAKRSILLPV